MYYATQENENPCALVLKLCFHSPCHTQITSTRLVQLQSIRTRGRGRMQLRNQADPSILESSLMQ